MYKIGELSKLCKIPVKTLRYYDSEGLLVPDEIDKFTGYRYYEASKLVDCNKILALKELGFTLIDIKKQMNARTPDDILSLLMAKQAELSDLLIQTKSQLKKLEVLKQIITEGENNMFDIVIRSTDTLRVAFHRQIYKTKEQALEKIANIKNTLPKSIVGKRDVIINYETEYGDSDFDLAACVEICGELPKDSAYIEKTSNFPTEVATLVCNKNELDEAYHAMSIQLEETSCQIIGAFYEVYHSDDTVELKVPVCRLTERSKTPKNDDINIPFVNDEKVIGLWSLIDCLPALDNFSIDKIKFNGENEIKDIYFLPGGEKCWCFGWTKGYVISSFGNPAENGLNKYTTQHINGKNYMFVEMKLNQSFFYNGCPEIWVLEQIDNIVHKKQDIGIRDDVDLPIIPDSKVIGKWNVCDIVKEIELFDPKAPNHNNDELFWVDIDFRADGTCTHTYDPKANRRWETDWTKGMLVDKRQKIAEAYLLIIIQGIEYLFIEFKSGDYTFGGRKPYYYVFVREQMK